ncbi:MAG: hypothetical protein AMXMBFR33_20440 [Candidatus Xenobia bacterium]
MLRLGVLEREGAGRELTEDVLRVVVDIGRPPGLDTLKPYCSCPVGNMAVTFRQTMLQR